MKKIKEILKKSYRFIPFKPYLFRLIRIFRTPPEKIYKHFHFNGKFSINFNGNKLWLINYSSMNETSIFWTGNFEEEKMSLKIWNELCSKSTYIFDIGANVGIYSLYAKSIKKNSNIIAFEPISRIYDRLLGNIQLNSFDIKTHQLAISNKNETTKIYDLSANHHYHASLKESELRGHNYDIIPTDVEVVTLDFFFNKNKLKGLDLLKIDVEGLEVEVIEGGLNTLNTYQPSILVEIKSEENATKIQSLLKNLNYVYYDIDEKNEKLIQIADLRKSLNWNLLLLNSSHNKFIQQIIMKKGN